MFPELAICGYPPEDLLLKAGLRRAQPAMPSHDLAERCDGHAAALVGWVEGHRVAGADPHDADDGPWNAAAVLHGGRVVGSYRKQALPNYGVFDEKRYFDPGHGGSGAVPHRRRRRRGDRVRGRVGRRRSRRCDAARAGAEVVVNLNASPFHRGKQAERERCWPPGSAESGLPIVYLNLVGGQDDLVFDGGSVVLGADGEVLAAAPRFGACELAVDLPVAGTTASPRTPWWCEVSEQVADAVGPIARAPRDLAHRAGRRRRPRPTAPPRSGPRSCSVCATTSPRTASATSSSGCPAASTRRSSRRSPPTRSAPTGCTAC